MNRKPIVIVGGVIANRYLNGGSAWTRLNWILGMRKLGFDVYFLEQISGDDCIDSQGRKIEFELSSNLSYFRTVLEEFGLAQYAALICDDGRSIHGMSSQELLDLASDADMIVNITGHLRLPMFMDSSACKIYVDLDPGYTQLWHEAGILGQQLLAHNHFFTIGETIGSRTCLIPLGGVPWIGIRQPVVLELWPVSRRGDPARFTTVANWRDGYGSMILEGQKLGLKVHEFRRFVEFPERVPQVCEIALNIYDEDSADLNLLERHGWVIKNPRIEVPGPSEFRNYIQESGAEFSVAKGMYTHTRTGWFSDRTVRYLASGKPALVQDTGFSKTYPVGSGLIAFGSIEEAVSGAQSIADNYLEHCEAARHLAETFFDSDKVLGSLVEQVGICP